MIKVCQWRALIVAHYHAVAMDVKKLQMQPNPHCISVQFFGFNSQLICEVLTALINCITKVIGMTNFQYQISNLATKELPEYHTCSFTLMCHNSDEFPHCRTLHAVEVFVFASVDLSSASVCKHLQRCRLACLNWCWRNSSPTIWVKMHHHPIQASRVKVGSGHVEVRLC